MSLFYTPNRYSGSLWAGKKVGLLGGSFNPAHEGHRHISMLALKHLGLDAVWWMVSPQNPLKSTIGMAAQQKRLESCIKVSNHPRILPTMIETELGTQYTADTLQHLKSMFSQTKFVWMMGTDNLLQIHKWQEWETIFKTYPIAILDRPPHTNSLKRCLAEQRFKHAKLPENQGKLLVSLKAPRWTILHTPLNELSSTEIRRKNSTNNT